MRGTAAARITRRLLASTVTTVLRRLPLSTQAEVRQAHQPARLLDYAEAPIWIHVDSLVELESRTTACRKEPETVDWIRTCILPGEVVYDVGANVGAYALLVDRVHGGRCVVYAFEPGFANYAQLNRNIVINGATGRVLALNIAMGSRVRLEALRHSDLATGAASHTVVELEADPTRGYVQPMLTYSIDEVVDTLGAPPPVHLKIDVDGTEAEVLRGAERTLRSTPVRSVLVELQADRPDVDEIEPMLVGHGFKVASVHPHGTGADATRNVIFRR